MLRLALLFLIIALIAGALGLGGVSFISGQIAWVLFVIFIILFLLSLLAGGLRRKALTATDITCAAATHEASCAWSATTRCRTITLDETNLVLRRFMGKPRRSVSRLRRPVVRARR